MTDLARKGKILTIRIFASLLLISIYTIVTYNIMVQPINPTKLTQQLVRLVLTIVLMYFIFKGEKWAVQVLTFLLVLGIFMGVVLLFGSVGSSPFIAQIPLWMMLFIYARAVYHLYFSASFQEYFDYLHE